MPIGTDDDDVGTLVAGDLANGHIRHQTGAEQDHRVLQLEGAIGIPE